MLRYRCVRGIVAAGALLALGGPLAQAQAPSSATQPGASQKPLVIDTGALTPFVENMDRSLAFYHDVFDMEVPPMPATGGPRPYNNPNPRLFAFFDITGAKERHQSARVQGRPHRHRADGDPAGAVQDGEPADSGSRQRHDRALGARHRHHAGTGEEGRVSGGIHRRNHAHARRRHARGDRPRRGQPLPRDSASRPRFRRRPRPTTSSTSARW